MTTTHPYFDGAPHPMAISHAGDTDSSEHGGSLAAYRLAHEHEFRWFQVDVVPIGGGRLGSAHAVFGRKRAWEDLTIEQVSKEVGRDVTTLNDLLDEFPDVKFNVEVKSRRAEAAVTALLEQPGAIGRVCISSPFHRGMSRRLRKRFGDSVCLAAPLADGGLIGLPLWPFRRVRHDTAQVWLPMIRSRKLVARVRTTGMRFQIWTANSATAIDRAVALGVTGIITDRHELLRDRLVDAGLWSEEVEP